MTREPGRRLVQAARIVGKRAGNARVRGADRESAPDRVLSIRQPWASLLVAGVKRFEVRTWRPRDVGWILIHASTGKAFGMRELRGERLFQLALRHAGIENEEAWPRSAIVGAVRIGHIWPPGSRPSNLSALDTYLGSASRDEYRWEVAEARRFDTPIPCDGKLNLWTPPRRLSNAIARAFRRVV